MELQDITDREYALIRQLLCQYAGISWGMEKKSLVVSRLFERVQANGLRSFGDYFTALKADAIPGELQIAIDLLTTCESYFFQEPEQFSFLEELAGKVPKTSLFRVWSAASSTGEEAYSIAMTLQELRCKWRCPDWEVRASDLNSQVLDKARSGIYSMGRIETIPTRLLKNYFLRGTGQYEGLALVNQKLRDKVVFAQINLIEPLPELVPFDVIFLRNVTSYFDLPIRRRVVSQLLLNLKPDGVLFVGMTEKLCGLVEGLVAIGPGVYRRDRRQLGR